MKKYHSTTIVLLLLTLLLTACQPIRPDGGAVTQQLDPAVIQQAYEQALSIKGAYGVTERVFDFLNEGQKVMATLALPDGGTQPYPVALLFHGFTGTRNELPWGAEIDLKTPFFEDLYHVNPIAAISTVNRPLLVIVGSRDTVVTPQPHYGQIYINYHRGSNGHPGDEMLVTLDGDHVFDVLTDQDPKVLDDAIAWSLAWLQQTLR
jgi:hypothetical protein